MASVHDVAAYILREQGAMTTWKLQKLTYYTQAWHLVWQGKPLFADAVEAWARGPVVPALYRHHAGEFIVAGWPAGNPQALLPEEQETIGKVLKFYGDKTPGWLSELTHRELPWRLARGGLEDGARSNRIITLDSMLDYYSSLAAHSH